MEFLALKGRFVFAHRHKWYFLDSLYVSFKIVFVRDYRFGILTQSLLAVKICPQIMCCTAFLQNVETNFPLLECELSVILSDSLLTNRIWWKWLCVTPRTSPKRHCHFCLAVTWIILSGGSQGPCHEETFLPLFWTDLFVFVYDGSRQEKVGW